MNILNTMSKVIINLCEENNLRVFDININDINGTSKQYYICHDKSKFKSNSRKINKILQFEKKLKLTKESTFKNFSKLLRNPK